MKRKMYELYLRIVRTLVFLLLRAVPFKKFEHLINDFTNSLEHVKTVTIDTSKKIHFFDVSNDTNFRAELFFVKEPETIDWIKGFNPQEDIFWDIGANIGVYSLFAGINGVQTFSFEPSFSNYALLNKNIQVNQLSHKISAYPVAFSESGKFLKLNMGDTEPGGACNQIGEAQEEMHYEGLGKTRVIFSQGTLALSIDQTISEFKLPSPTHLKIDVDGVEDLIIKGATETLKSSKLKSVLIEINEKSSGADFILTKMKDNGFSFLKFPGDKDFPHIRNYIFSRIN